MPKRQPLDRKYRPGYPVRLTEEEIRQILQPNLLTRFTRAVVLLTAALVRTTAQAEEGPPKVSNDQAAQERARAVQAIADEAMAMHQNGFWGEHTKLLLKREIVGNPPVKCPQIPISYGNSHVGIIDIAGARATTEKLFAQYGIALRPDQRVQGEGYDFVADGWDPQRMIGYKLLGKHDRRRGEKGSDDLGAEELKAVEKDVLSGKVKVFIAHADDFPNMDGDLRTVTRYYLASVIDYLNFIHGNTNLDLKSVLGEPPGGQSTGWKSIGGALPGCGFEVDEDLKLWGVEKGKVQRSTKWSEFGNASLQVQLEAGGTLRYAAAQPLPLAQRSCCLAACILLEKRLAETLNVTFTFYGNGQSQWQEKVEIKAGEVHKPIWRYVDKPVEQLTSFTITTDAKGRVTFNIDDIALSLAQTRDPAEK